MLVFVETAKRHAVAAAEAALSPPQLWKSLEKSLFFFYDGKPGKIPIAFYHETFHSEFNNQFFI